MRRFNITSFTVIKASDIDFSYNPETLVLNAVNLEIERGASFGLLGPNGAGKTTLISLLTGLYKPQKGNIEISGISYDRHRPRILQQLSVVPQEYAFYPQLSVTENLNFFAALFPQKKTNRKARIKEAVKMTGLASHRNRIAKHFSGGLKRRLNLAIGLLNNPALLILDEPTVGIDPQSRHFILQAIKSLNSKGTTILYTSHYMEEVEQLCDSIAIMDHGKILTVGSLETLLSKETHIVIKTDKNITEHATKLLRLFTQDSLKTTSNQLEATLKSEKLLPELIQNIQSNGFNIIDIEFGSQTLESLFFKLTHTALRD